MESQINSKNKLQLIARKEFVKYDDMYLVIDFLNKNLSEYNLVFGVTEDNDKNVLNIYKE